MTDEWVAKYLADARDAALSILGFVAEHRFDDYVQDKMLRSAVERQFTIVGEALLRVRRLDPDLASGIPDISDILAFRNILVHAYAAVDHGVVWGTIRNDVPGLITHIDGVLERLDKPSG